MGSIKKILKYTFGFVFISFSLLIIIALMFGPSSTDSEKSNIVMDDVSSNETLQKQNDNTYSGTTYNSIGDRTVADDVAYTVISVEYDEEDPTWVDIEIEIENLGKETREYYHPDNNIKIISEKGQEYEPLTGLTTWERGLDKLSPGIPIEVSLVFEVPRGQKYYAEVSGSAWGESEKIDIGTIPL